MRLLIFLLTLLTLISGCIPTSTREADETVNAKIQQKEENARLLRAIDAHVGSREYSKAREIFENGSFNQEEIEIESRIKILNAQLELESGKTEEALNLLRKIAEDQIPFTFIIAYHEILARANLENGNYLKAAIEQLKVTKYSNSPDSLENNSLRLWKIIELIPDEELESLRTDAPELLKSWIELAIINKRYKYETQKLKDAVYGWTQLNEDHYAQLSITEKLIQDSFELAKRPKKIALLLPLTGKLKNPSIAVRDGFLAAWYLDMKKKGEVEIYDANSLNIIEVYQQALDDGADYIVGPLEKEATNHLYENTDGSIKILTLTRRNIEKEMRENKNLFQFGLIAEDEIEQITKIAFNDGHKRALVLTPDTPWGILLAEMFKENWEKLGGEINEHSSYSDNTDDFSSPVKKLLNIDLSEQRAKHLRNKLKIKIHNEVRRRQDSDCIFTAGNIAKNARQLIPQIRFHHADNLPIYSTSHIFTGVADSEKDIDLNGVTFVDIPWILDTKRQLSIIQDQLNKNWSQEKSKYRRFYALGIDAYRIIPELNRLANEKNSIMTGETGDLSIVSDNIIKRNLRKAKFLEGKPVLLN